MPCGRAQAPNGRRHTRAYCIYANIAICGKYPEKILKKFHSPQSFCARRVSWGTCASCVVASEGAELKTTSKMWRMLSPRVSAQRMPGVTMGPPRYARRRRAVKHRWLNVCVAVIYVAAFTAHLRCANSLISSYTPGTCYALTPGFRIRHISDVVSMYPLLFQSKMYGRGISGRGGRWRR